MKVFGNEIENYMIYAPLQVSGNFYLCYYGFRPLFGEISLSPYRQIQKCNITSRITGIINIRNYDMKILATQLIPLLPNLFLLHIRSCSLISLTKTSLTILTPFYPYSFNQPLSLHCSPI